ncbi:DUF3883 domain-containing protein [Micrococcaceae bacterium Sec5.1]|uniref:protein NO VEIN domain-containing protein n=1 Tax=Paenarthrobacter sp. 2TAF44 TaxID=3233018 RepID=UPI003366616B
MVINIRLSDRKTAESDDPLGRTWYGYDPSVTPELLWENNRGDWSLNADRISEHRWAALNYQGRVVLVAELLDPNHEILPSTSRVPKKALLGRVLEGGSAIYDALIGTQVDYPAGSRNSILYTADPAVAGPAASDLLNGGIDLPGARGQGKQMDAEIRRVIENAAQDRLMGLYVEQGWTVTDTRLNHPYDALAVKGNERIYLEAKGTQSRGESVIVTRNEVNHARRHPGSCVMGVWSGIRFVGGEIDPDSGEFITLDFSPTDEQLSPRDFDWTLPETAT